MKNINRILIMFAAVLAFTSCKDTYDDTPSNATTAVAPLDGRWICLMFDYNEYQTTHGSKDTLEYVDVWASNTANNDRDKMWFNINNSLNHYPLVDCQSIKINCDPSNLSFSINNSQTVQPSGQAYNTAVGGAQYTYPRQTSTYVFVPSTITIENGKVTINGWNTPSGGKADLIEFDYTIDGKKYKVIGNRYTQWEDDYMYITDFINNY